MSFADIKGHQHVITLLKQQIKEKRLAHAYLFSGPHGVGKRTTAIAFAQALQCPIGGDDNCVVCKRIQNRNFPDVDIVDYEWQMIVEDKPRASKRQTIGIDAIKELHHRVALKPMEGDWKFFIVDKAETMTAEAANCFLKILEEPPRYTLFILIAEHLFKVLPTIRSRCQLMRFGYLNKKDFSMVLKKDGISVNEWYDVSDGSPGMAVHYYEDKADTEEHIIPLWRMMTAGNILEALSHAQRSFDSKEEIEYLCEQLLMIARTAFKEQPHIWHQPLMMILKTLNLLKKNINARLVRDNLIIYISRDMYAHSSRDSLTKN